MNSGRFFPGRGRLAQWVLAPLLVMVAALYAGPGAFAQTSTALDPPGRVAQLNYFDGPVSFEPAGYDQWAGAVLNRPLTQGDRLWNDAGARSELHIDSTALRLDGSTSMSFTTLDDQTVQIALTQGSLIARLRSLPTGQRFEIDTPNLAFTASQPGDYRIDVDPAAGTTRVTLQSGGAVVYGSNGASADVAAREQITFGGNDLAQVAAQTAPAPDVFDRWAAARDLEEDRSVSARYVSRDVSGYQQLDQYGTWENDPSYGNVWVPRVTVTDWAPYRVGHWASIAPWGWTWIDDEPWGFAPFHYGRWAQLGTRWCWVPGARDVRPVYAPALVAFVGGAVGGINFNISVGGAARPGVAWFPLAPGEAWHPWFHANPTYVTNVNRTMIVHNVTNITNVTNVYRYQHLPTAVTAVSASAFTQGQHVRGNARPVTVAELQRARVAAPPAPTRDPRSAFGASRLTQAHPAPPAAAVERRVVSNPAFSRGRPGAPAGREALPGPQEHPQAPANAATPPRGRFSPGPEREAPPARPPVRAPLANVPQMPREPLERSAPSRNEAIVAPQPAAPSRPPQSALPHQPPVQQQGQREQLQREQAERAQNAQRDQAARMQQDQVRRAQAQNEQAARTAQIQSQKAQESQRAQQQMRQAQESQRAQQEQQRRQTPAEAQMQRPRPAQEQRGAQTPDNRERPKAAGEAQRPRSEEQRPAQGN
ncbi:MAG: DUF6600 domain-containing protein [Rhodoferax sp.]